MSLVPGMVDRGCGFDSQKTMKEAGRPDWYGVPGIMHSPSLAHGL